MGAHLNTVKLARSCTILGMLFVVCPMVLRAQSGAFGLYEVSAPGAGEAYAGQSAVADDASTAYLNPAGMTRLRGRHMVVGGQFLDLSMEFHPGVGRSGGNAGGANVVPAAYFVGSLTDRLRFGMSLNQSFGAALNYSDDWAGRYFIRDIQLVALDFRPSLAFLVNRRLSIGGGPAIQRVSLSKTLALPNVDPGYSQDGKLDVSLHDWGVGLHAGLLFQAGARTRVGATYRSKTNFELRGKSSMRGVGPSMAAALAGSLSGANPLHLPQGANVSVYQVLTPAVALLADAGWSNWRHFGEKAATQPGGTSVPVDANWRDTWRTGVGVRLRVSPKLSLQTGASYDSSPVSDWNRTPDIPVGRQRRMAAGVRYALAPSLSLGASFTYLDLGTLKISHLTNPVAGTLEGRYSSARLPVVALTLTMTPVE